MNSARGLARGPALLLAAALALAAGCGVKITAPRPVGLFSVNAYTLAKTYADDQPRQVAVIQNSVFVLSASGVLAKRNLSYGEIARTGALAQPTAFCGEEAAEFVYVWEQGPHRLLVLRSTDLAPVDSSLAPALAEVEGVAALAACQRGVEVEPGARTFLYLSDPDAGVIHRYAYAGNGEFRAHGILARAEGSGARSVHAPAGLAVDAAGMLLVCDADTARNWVIRFDPTPDTTDLTPAWNGFAPERGLAIPFDQPTCEPASLADVTLGYAAECGQTDWVGRRGSADGEFDVPRAATVDGHGAIYVADSGNDRVQVFTDAGLFDLRFGNAERTPSPASLSVVDWRISSTKVNYGAYLYVVDPAANVVRKFISSEQYLYENQEPPPPPF